MPLPNIIENISSHLKLLRAQEYGLEIRSGEIRKKIKQELYFLHMTLLLDLIYVPTKYYQIMSNRMGVMAGTRFMFIRKKVRVVCLARDMPTGPLHPYQYLRVSKLTEGRTDGRQADRYIP